MQYSLEDGLPYYIELTGDTDFRQLFSSKKNLALFESIDEERAMYRYAPGKWSIKQIVGHITDHERIMVYRSLRFSRKDRTQLAQYDQNLLVDNSRFDELSYQQVLTDYKNVRNATNSFIDTLSESQLNLTGTIWKYELPVEAFLKGTIGHEMHHMDILSARYGVVGKDADRL